MSSLKRNFSFWNHEQGPTHFMDQNLSAHHADEDTTPTSSAKEELRDDSVDSSVKKTIFNASLPTTVEEETQHLNRSNHSHARNSNLLNTRPWSNINAIRSPIYGACERLQRKNTIRFQVIVWSIEKPDVSLSHVGMKFRASKKNDQNEYMRP